MRHYFALFRLKICYCSWPPKGGLYAILRGSCAIFSVEIPPPPWFQQISMPYGPPLYGIFWGHFFWQIPFVQMALQTEKNYFRINYAFPSRYRYRRKTFRNSFFVADADTALLCSFEGGRIADRICFRFLFYFIADADTEKYYFRIISAMNSDKRYGGWGWSDLFSLVFASCVRSEP